MSEKNQKILKYVWLGIVILVFVLFGVFPNTGTKILMIVTVFLSACAVVFLVHEHPGEV